METNTVSQAGVLTTKDEVIDFVITAIKDNKEKLKEPIHAEVDCEDLRGTRILAEAYLGTEEGYDFNMPLERPNARKELENLLIQAKGNSSRSFVTVSAKGFKILWMVRYYAK
jgi:hypothetical protein